MLTAPETETNPTGMSAMTLPTKLAIRFEATEMAVRDALAQVLAFLRNAGLDSDNSGKAEIVLAEALNNIVEHAYCNIGQGKVELQCTHHPARLDVTILDQGKPVPVHVFAKRRYPDTDSALPDLPEGGFGWLLIQTLAENLTYQRVGDTNCLRLTIPLLVAA